MINLYESELIDILPDNLKSDMHIQAFCYAFDKQIRKIIDRSKRLEIWSNLYDVDERLLDYLAAELRTQYYSPDLDVDVKRKFVSNTLIWYQKAGTVAAVQELVETLFEEGKIAEWYDYGGLPHHFKVKVVNPLIDDNNLKNFYNIIKQVKRKTAILDAFEFFYNGLFKVPIYVDSKMLLRSDFYPRYNLPLLLLDGNWDLDGTYSLNGYKTDDTIEFYPARLNLKAELNVKPEIESTLTVEKDLWYLDGVYNLDGEKILDAEIITQTL